MAAINFGNNKDTKIDKPKSQVENGYINCYGAPIVAFIDLFLIIIGWILFVICGIGFFYYAFPKEKMNNYVSIGFLLGWLCFFVLAWVLYELGKINSKLFLGIEEKSVDLIDNWINQNIIIMLILGGFMIYNQISGSFEFYQYPHGYFIIYRGITLPFVYKFKNQLEKEIEKEISLNLEEFDINIVD